MSQIGSWNGIIFEVSPNIIRGYTGLTIEGGSETEDKVSDKYAYVKRKNSTPTTVSMEVYLNAYLGCNVRDEAMALIKAATDGEKNYFYVAGKKLISCQLMLVNAKVTETTTTPKGDWTSCKIALSMKQCEKYSGGSSGSSSGGSSGSKSSSKKTTQAKKQTVKQQSWLDKAVDAVQSVVSTVKTAASNLAAKVTGSVKNTAQSKIASTTAAAASAKNDQRKEAAKQSTLSKAQNNIAKGVAAAYKVSATAKKTTTTMKSTTVKKPAAKTTSTAQSKIKAAGK